MRFEFYYGKEIPPPSPIDNTLPQAEVFARRRAWVTELDRGIRDEDAWAILVTYPDMRVELFDCRWSSIVRATRRGATAHLLLGREQR